jgi:hypothetical protein
MLITVQYFHSYPPYLDTILIYPQFEDAPRSGGKDPPNTDVTHYSDTNAAYDTSATIFTALTFKVHVNCGVTSKQPTAGEK